MITTSEQVHYTAATGLLSALWLLLALPAAGTAILLLSGKRSATWGPYLACAMTGGSFGYAVLCFFALKKLPAGERSQDLHLFSWIPVADFKVDAGLLLDPLSMTFVLLITGVGFLIHVYSLGYMEHDPRKKTFFAYLNLFVTAMLLLVLGNSFLALYVGWEGVVSPPTCSSPSGSTSPRLPRRRRRPSSPTGSVTSACRWRSWSCSRPWAPRRTPGSSATPVP